MISFFFLNVQSAMSDYPLLIRFRSVGMSLFLLLFISTNCNRKYNFLSNILSSLHLFLPARSTTLQSETRDNNGLGPYLVLSLSLFLSVCARRQGPWPGSSGLARSAQTTLRDIVLSSRHVLAGKKKSSI